MQVNVIDGGRSAFNAMMYDTPGANTVNWLSSNISRARELLTGVADNLVDATVNMYNKVNSDGAINMAKSIISSQGGNCNQYTIYALNAETLPNANYIMQQYVMANPMVQDLYRDNMCHGYEETYYNAEPDVYGTDRMDYQRVMDGVLHEDGDVMTIHHYSNSDDVELSDSDRFLILESWKQAECMILNDIDPTDPDN